MRQPTKLGEWHVSGAQGTPRGSSPDGAAAGRLGECIKLRVNDIDHELVQVLERAGKGGEDRITLPRDSPGPMIVEHLKRPRTLCPGQCQMPRPGQAHS
jgi:hypothetical protein